MLLAYIDESGNTGHLTASNGASLTYTLGCVLVRAEDWPAAFDNLLNFRRRLRDRFNVPMRAEIKANYLLRSEGDIRHLKLSPNERFLIYRAHLRQLEHLPARAFSVVVDKRHQQFDYFEVAWQTMFQRLRMTTIKENEPLMLLHDEGENDRVRAWLRRARRYITAGDGHGGYIRGQMSLLVDDAVPRKSHQSYLIQCADLVAYAGFRSVVPPGPAVARVCPQTMWDELGQAIHRPVNSVKPRAAPGIVYR